MKRSIVGIALSLISLSTPARAQTFPMEDPVLRRIWSVGVDSSRVMDLAQVLTDSIGPRLTGTPGIEASQAWLAATYSAIAENPIETTMVGGIRFDAIRLSMMAGIGLPSENPPPIVTTSRQGCWPAIAADGT